MRAARVTYINGPVTYIGGPVILAGDFNSHVGKDGGPRAQGNQNPHGELLLELVHNNDMYITSQ